MYKRIWILPSKIKAELIIWIPYSLHKDDVENDMYRHWIYLLYIHKNEQAKIIQILITVHGKGKGNSTC